MPKGMKCQGTYYSNFMALPLYHHFPQANCMRESLHCSGCTCTTTMALSETSALLVPRVIYDKSDVEIKYSFNKPWMENFYYLFYHL